MWAVHSVCFYLKQDTFLLCVLAFGFTELLWELNILIKDTNTYFKRRKRTDVQNSSLSAGASWDSKWNSWEQRCWFLCQFSNEVWELLTQTWMLLDNWCAYSSLPLWLVAYKPSLVLPGEDSSCLEMCYSFLLRTSGDVMLGHLYLLSI